MSHKITERDNVYLARIPELHDGKGWHGKGIPHAEFTEESLKKILFGIQFMPAMVNGHETGQRYAVADDDGLPIGNAIGDRYNTPSNTDLFRLFKDALAGSDYELCSALTVDGRVEFALDAKGKTAQAAGRDITPFVGLSRMFGGQGTILVCGHSTVIQCGNTTALFRSEAVGKEDCSSFKNTLNVMSKLPLLKRQIELQHGVQGEFVRAMESATKIAVSRDNARAAFVGLVVPKDAKELATRSANRVNRLSDLFVTGKGNTGRNAADWYNAVTDYFTHENAGSEDTAETKEAFLDKQYDSSERGAGMQVKYNLTKTMMQKGRFVQAPLLALQQRGRKILDDSTKDVLAVLN